MPALKELTARENSNARATPRSLPLDGLRGNKQPNSPLIHLSEVALHNTKEDAWIAVNGKVYDITAFIRNHPGWDCACGISTILAILRCLGTDCTVEFNEIHTGAAHMQLRAYYIGNLAPVPVEAKTAAMDLLSQE